MPAFKSLDTFEGVKSLAIKIVECDIPFTLDDAQEAPYENHFGWYLPLGENEVTTAFFMTFRSLTSTSLN